MVVPHVSPTGDLARNPGMCPDWEPFDLQAHRAQSIELYQTGQFIYFLKIFHLFIFRERGREGGKTSMWRYIYQLPLARSQLGTWPATQACALSVRRPALSPPSHTSQGLCRRFRTMPLLGRLRIRNKQKVYQCKGGKEQA